MSYNVRFSDFTQYDGLKSIHLAANSITSFILVAELYPIVYVYHIFFIYLFVDGH